MVASAAAMLCRRTLSFAFIEEQRDIWMYGGAPLLLSSSCSMYKCGVRSHHIERSIISHSHHRILKSKIIIIIAMARHHRRSAKQRNAHSAHTRNARHSWIPHYPHANNDSTKRKESEIKNLRRSFEQSQMRVSNFNGIEWMNKIEFFSFFDSNIFELNFKFSIEFVHKIDRFDSMENKSDDIPAKNELENYLLQQLAVVVWLNRVFSLCVCVRWGIVGATNVHPHNHLRIHRFWCHWLWCISTTATTV